MGIDDGDDERAELSVLRALAEEGGRALYAISTYADWGVDSEGEFFFDIRPAVDERELPGHRVDENRRYIDVALALGVVTRHRSKPHLIGVPGGMARLFADRLPWRNHTELPADE